MRIIIFFALILGCSSVYGYNFEADSPTLQETLRIFAKQPARVAEALGSRSESFMDKVLGVDSQNPIRLADFLANKKLNRKLSVRRFAALCRFFDPFPVADKDIGPLEPIESIREMMERVDWLERQGQTTTFVSEFMGDIDKWYDRSAIVVKAYLMSTPEYMRHDYISTLLDEIETRSHKDPVTAALAFSILLSGPETKEIVSRPHFNKVIYANPHAQFRNLMKLLSLGRTECLTSGVIERLSVLQVRILARSYPKAFASVTGQVQPDLRDGLNAILKHCGDLKASAKDHKI